MQHHIVQILFAVIVSLCMSVIQVDAQCRSIYGKGVSNEDIRIILKGHNDLRSDIAQGKYIQYGLPRGKDFKKMVWDNKLAQAAQRISDTCVLQHQRITDGRWGSVGQNLHISMSTANSRGAEWKAALKSWAGEYNRYQFGKTITKQNGHLTQMIWADTKFIGCGFTNFLSNDPKFKYKKLYVCNYGPGGNYPNRQPYRT